MRFQLDNTTAATLNANIAKEPDLLNTILGQYVQASTNMDESNRQDTLVEILSTHYKRLTKENQIGSTQN